MVLILGGTWGLYNSRDRKRAYKIYNLVKDHKIASNFHQKGQKYIKGRDQDFLGQHVFDRS